MKIAHISDPHFATVSFGLRQFLSKRWLGNLNLMLFRQHRYQTDHLWELPELLKSLGVEWIVITGDFATTSLKEEFLEAARWVSQMPAPVLVLPGNHDAYTKGSEREKRFYQFFPDEEMKNHRVVSKSLGDGWWWVGLDCAIATSVFFSNGKFFHETEEQLTTHIFSEMPKEAKVILGNHFPLYRSGSPRHDLSRCKKLQAIMRKYPQVKLYLHGHDHKAYLVDKTKEGFPLVLNSGSCAHTPGGTFYLIDLEPNQCSVTQVKLEKNENRFSWMVGEKSPYLFR